VLLVGADEQGSGEGIKSPLPGSFGRLCQAQLEAVPAALCFMPRHLAEVCHYVITLANNQGQVGLLSQGLHAFQAMLVLGIGVDIGVVP